ncbi:MAG: three-Cys-motif partner protein TcmP, partial [Nitrospinae bacterium]|nr:three-Cys-motif partner protein TcmP [Nitrospinota bacterium]
MTGQKIPLDKIGYWSELKLEIIKKYAEAYSKILKKQKGLKHLYIDAFAGTGVHLSKKTEEIVPGSPLNALNVQPPFYEYHFIDKNEKKIEFLKTISQGRSNVEIYHGDCNSILVDQVFPKVRYEDYKRGLCFLDPYGLHLNWEVIQQAGTMGTIDIFLNFPIYDMNLNVLLCDPSKARPRE